jgi:hypothetical protein
MVTCFIPIPDFLQNNLQHSKTRFLVGRKENDGGVNLTKIYCKHFVKVTMYPQLQ